MSKMCDICCKKKNDPVEYGEFMEHAKICVHYYCLLQSTYLEQLGKDRSAFLGFQVPEIKKEIQNAKKRICYYCGKYNASIKCELCTKYFHLVCGLQKNCLFQYVGNFSSYCHEHHNIKHSSSHKPNDGCYICLKLMGEYNPLTSIMSKCCSIGWIHRRCLKEYALAAGYYLKCLWCENKEFRNDVRLMGIFVPDREARWEKEKNAYADFYKKHSSCTVVKCLCPKGRKHISKKWKIYICSVCGGNGVHEPCSRETIDDDNFICKTCNNTFKNTPRTRGNNNAPDFSMYMSKTQCTVSEMMFDQEDTVCQDINVSSSDEDLTHNCGAQAQEPVQERKNIEKEKDLYLILDEKNQNIIGILEGIPKKPSNNLPYTPISELDYRAEHVCFARPNSIENGHRLIEENLRQLVKKFIIDPKNSKNEVIEVESDSEQSASGVLEKMFVGDSAVTKAINNGDKFGSDIDLNEPGPSWRFAGKDTIKEDITDQKGKNSNSDKKEEIIIVEGNDPQLSSMHTQKKNMLDSDELKKMDINEKKAAAGFGLENGNENDMKNFMLSLFLDRMVYYAAENPI